jgi:hypothetical protein
LGFLDDFKEQIESVVNDVAEHVVGLTSMGQLKYKDGKLTSPLLESDFVRDIGRSVKSVSPELLNAQVNLMTGGMAGYKDGKITEGLDFKVLDRITGRDLVERQMRMQEAQIEREEKLRDRFLLEERTTRQHEDLAASNMAQASRRSAEMRSGFFGSPLERNFLGL